MRLAQSSRVFRYVPSFDTGGNADHKLGLLLYVDPEAWRNRNESDAWKVDCPSRVTEDGNDCFHVHGLSPAPCHSSMEA